MSEVPPYFIRFSLVRRLPADGGRGGIALAGGARFLMGKVPLQCASRSYAEMAGGEESRLRLLAAGGAPSGSNPDGRTYLPQRDLC